MTSKPLRIGFDFDNTIVCYDAAITVLAEEMFSLPPELPRTKLGLRNYLRAAGREPEWTTFQGALYGPGMAHAQPFDGAINTMRLLAKEGHQLMIVSHRSRTPYAGPPHDLHAAARDWVQQHLQSSGLFQNETTDPAESGAVNFLETREDKVARLAELGCQVFVDDLLEVLEAPGFPKEAVGILFAPGYESTSQSEQQRISCWQQLPGLLAQLP
jgi:hypothetical protein